MSWFFWAILSATFAGLTAILVKLGVSGVDSDLATAIRTTVILVLAAVVLRESISWQHWLGGALILAGAVVVALD